MAYIRALTVDVVVVGSATLSSCIGGFRIVSLLESYHARVSDKAIAVSATTRNSISKVIQEMQMVIRYLAPVA